MMNRAPTTPISPVAVSPARTTGLPRLRSRNVIVSSPRDRLNFVCLHSRLPIRLALVLERRDPGWDPTCNLGSRRCRPAVLASVSEPSGSADSAPCAQTGSDLTLLWPRVHLCRRMRLLSPVATGRRFSSGTGQS
jgi:hypothetical protein